MKKKGQRTFNNENVHRIKMLGLHVTLYPLYVLSMAAGPGPKKQRSKQKKNNAWSQVSSLMIMQSMHFSRSRLVYFNREKSSVFPQISNYFLKKNFAPTASLPYLRPQLVIPTISDTLSSPRESVRPYLDDHRPTSECISGWTTRKFKGCHDTRAALPWKKKHWRCERFIGFWSQLWQNQRSFSI